MKVIRKKIAIYGAKSIALGTYYALREICPEYHISCFLVTSKDKNPDMLAGLPVIELQEFRDKDMEILVATTENLHEEIISHLKQNGICNYVCLDSRKEAVIMERYYTKSDRFLSLHSLFRMEEYTKLHVYMAKFHRDRSLQRTYEFPFWITPIQVGAALTNMHICELTDHVSDNISHKNVNYCELTAMYSVWKNELKKYQNNEYIGICHYRRMMDISEEDLFKIKGNNVDVILPFPMIYEPNISEHHTRYISESDWSVMKNVIKELYPDYMAYFEEIFAQQYMYNYNMLIAKKKVFEEYCTWLFPILSRIEELSMPKGNERADRYIGYLGENLLTLYFMYNKSKLKIVHTGRVMLT